MARRHVSFALSAVTDLQELQAFYADQQAPEVGHQLVAEIVAVVERLADFPESGRVVPEFEIHDVREVIHPPFRIVYRLTDDRVRVVRVWRGERPLRLP